MHERRFSDTRDMSALPPILAVTADIPDRQVRAKRSQHPNQASGVRNVSFMRQAPKNETAAAAMIR